MQKKKKKWIKTKLEFLFRNDDNDGEMSRLWIGERKKNPNSGKKILWVASQRLFDSNAEWNEIHFILAWSILRLRNVWRIFFFSSTECGEIPWILILRFPLDRCAATERWNAGDHRIHIWILLNAVRSELRTGWLRKPINATETFHSVLPFTVANRAFRFPHSLLFTFLGSSWEKLLLHYLRE